MPVFPKLLGALLLTVAPSSFADPDLTHPQQIADETGSHSWQIYRDTALPHVYFYFPRGFAVAASSMGQPDLNVFPSADGWALEFIWGVTEDRTAVVQAMLRADPAGLLRLPTAVTSRIFWDPDLLDLAKTFTPPTGTGLDAAAGTPQTAFFHFDSAQKSEVVDRLTNGGGGFTNKVVSRYLFDDAALGAVYAEQTTPFFLGNFRRCHLEGPRCR